MSGALAVAEIFQAQCTQSTSIKSVMLGWNLCAMFFINVASRSGLAKATIPIYGQSSWVLVDYMEHMLQVLESDTLTEKYICVIPWLIWGI